jgi:hypothetical protein
MRCCNRQRIKTASLTQIDYNSHQRPLRVRPLARMSGASIKLTGNVALALGICFAAYLVWLFLARS